MPIILSVEGNIGSGKSTLVSNMKKVFGEKLKGYKVVFLQEPVEVWESIKASDNESIITKFYNDKERYAFSFQMMAYISRLQLLSETIEKYPDNTIIICERSIWTDKNIFAKMLYDDKFIDEINYNIYNKWFEFFSKNTDLNGIIYLNTDPSVCNERVIKRNREGENIPISYLERCHEYHNDWLFKTHKSILTLNDSDKKTEDLTPEWVCSISKFILNLAKNKKDITLDNVFNKMWC